MRPPARRKRIVVFSLAVAFLLIAAHRLPAPISEIPESPPPAREQQARPKKTQSKSRAAESEPKAKSAPPARQGPARFAGTWTGTINQGILGTPTVKLVINSDATSVTDSSNLEAVATHGAKTNGNMLQWHTGWGWMKGLLWTLTPNPDGQTAVVTSKSMVSVYGPATFSRLQGAETSTR